jgi:hypothetical protein
MDIAAQAEIILREGGYDTWLSPGVSPVVTCFENAALIGFLHVFSSAEELLNQWETSQRAVLSRHGMVLRAAGAKAWNVYSVFLTAGQSKIHLRAIERIEEDFALTRKIARTAVRTAVDMERALLPLIAVKARASLAAADFEARLRSRVKDIAPAALTAFLGETRAEEVARILGAEP